MAENTSMKGAAIAVGSAVLIAILAGATKPWWYCTVVGSCASSQSSSETSGGSAVKAATPMNSGGPSQLQSNDSTTEPPKPEAPKFVPAHMGDLMMQTDLHGLDINNGEIVQDVNACVKLCADNDECHAMTYVYPATTNTQNGTCWLKGGIPTGIPNPYMISAKKIPAIGG